MNKRDEILTAFLNSCIEKKILPSPFELAGISFSIATNLIQKRINELRESQDGCGCGEPNATFFLLEEFLESFEKEGVTIYGPR